jgi:hypothetical protein
MESCQDVTGSARRSVARLHDALRDQARVRAGRARTSTHGGARFGLGARRGHRARAFGSCGTRPAGSRWPAGTTGWITWSTSARSWTSRGHCSGRTVTWRRSAKISKTCPAGWVAGRALLDDVWRSQPGDGACQDGCGAMGPSDSVAQNLD